MPTYYKISSNTLTAIADAVRAKTGKSETISGAELAAELQASQDAGGLTFFGAAKGDLPPVQRGFASSTLDMAGVKLETSAVGALSE